MSRYNESNLIHMIGNVWISRPMAGGATMSNKSSTICVQISEGYFGAVGYLRLESNGEYFIGDKTLGRIDDLRLMEYIKTTYIGQDRESAIADVDVDDLDIISAVCELYKKTKNVRRVASRTHIAEKMIRRILYTKGLYDSDNCRKVSSMLESGKTIEQVAGLMGISVRTAVAYTKLSESEIKKLVG